MHWHFWIPILPTVEIIFFLIVYPLVLSIFFVHSFAPHVLHLLFDLSVTPHPLPLSHSLLTLFTYLLPAFPQFSSVSLNFILPAVVCHDLSQWNKDIYPIGKPER
jgi:hypothetical protein